MPPQVAEALYVAMLTHTGGFRFANTRRGATGGRLAAGARRCTRSGVYEQVYATAPSPLRLTAEVLDTLVSSRRSACRG